MTYREAIDLIDTLADKDGTHTHASVNGWAWPLSRSDMVLQLLTTAFINAHRSERSPTFTMPWPWNHKPVVSPERREQLEKQLQRRSAFRD